MGRATLTRPGPEGSARNDGMEVVEKSCVDGRSLAAIFPNKETFLDGSPSSRRGFDSYWRFSLLIIIRQRRFAFHRRVNCTVNTVSNTCCLHFTLPRESDFARFILRRVYLRFRSLFYAGGVRIAVYSVCVGFLSKMGYFVSMVTVLRTCLGRIYAY